MTNTIAKIWAKRIIAGTQKIEDCPIKYRAEVEELIKKASENPKP